MGRDPIRNELRGLDAWLTREDRRTVLLASGEFVNIHARPANVYDRSDPEPLDTITFDVSDALMEMEDGELVPLGSDWRFECRWWNGQLVISEIYIKRYVGRGFVFASFDLNGAPTAKHICAALRRYYHEHPNGQDALRWFAEDAEEQARMEL